MSPLLEWGIPIIEWLQNLGDGLLPVMKFFTFLGTEIFYLLVLPTLLWCIDARFGFRVGLILLTSSSINSILKLALGWPRPYWVSDKVRALSAETTFGSPSGHAQNALSLWGRIISLVKNRLVITICVLLILLISISRLFLGVHFPTDIIFGWIVGGILLLLFIKFEAPVQRWLLNRSLMSQFLLVLGLSIALLATGLLVSVATSSRLVPAEWGERASTAIPDADPISPKDIDDIVSSSGVLLGIGAGGILLFSWGRFNAGGPLQQRIFRYVVGVVGVVVIFFGLRWLFPAEPLLLGQILRFIRYGIVGFWVAYAAPRLFVKLKLA
jgi:membrane-associated phospholipid phosphatase